MIKPNSLVIAFLLALPPPLIHGGTYDMVHGKCESIYRVTKKLQKKKFLFPNYRDSTI